MKRVLYRTKNLKSRLWILVVVVVILSIAIKYPLLRVAVIAALLILGYKYFLPGDFRIAYDDRYLYLDNLIRSKQIPWQEITRIVRNKWNFTSSGNGAVTEYGYKIFYIDGGIEKEEDALVGFDFYEEWEAFRKNTKP